MVGTRIKELRVQKGYSICELARLANVSKSYLSQIERGLHKNPSIQVLSKVGKTLGTSVEGLLKEEHSAGKDEIVLDSEWREMLVTAIKEGLRKEDFVEYRKFMKYETWRKEHKSIHEDLQK
ncbi:helix-turn-helix domain-containing protein [Neobacillus sp. SCS-31]|uniref:helix-turn-helix domain-containing protein n=1 Tax=Neobacillus oceani TaxID=3115292 RepID=UPI0039068BAF